MQVWNVYCPYCNKSTTVTSKPKKDEKHSYTTCVVCGKPIDAKRGGMRRLKWPKQPELAQDLLEII